MDITKPVIAEGPSEFRAKPEDFMSLVNGMNLEALLPKNNKPKQLVQQLKEESDKENKKEMKKILSDFHNMADSVVYQVASEPEVQKAVAKKIIMEHNEEKEWVVQINEGKVNKYSVHNIHSKKSFFDDIFLKESAIKLTNILNSGVSINNKKVTNVLYYENVFQKHYNDAINFKRILKKAKLQMNESKVGIFEDKFDAAKEKALAAKREIKNI